MKKREMKARGGNLYESEEANSIGSRNFLKLGVERRGSEQGALTFGDLGVKIKLRILRNCPFMICFFYRESF
jgi:hypothetical protein